MRTPKTTLPITLQDFPHGSCGDATLLLGHYLTAQGHGEFRYYFGWRCGKSHAWLQAGSVIVDITGDQFDVSDRSSWHQDWTA